MNNNNKGLYPKYYVQKLIYEVDQRGEETVTPIPTPDWVFVLNPKHDPGAVAALKAYIAWASDNGYELLAKDLEDKLEELGKADW